MIMRIKYWGYVLIITTYSSTLGNAFWCDKSTLDPGDTKVKVKDIKKNFQHALTKTSVKNIVWANQNIGGKGGKK